MAEGLFNIARGRIGYYGTLPAASDAFIVVLLRSAESDSALVEYDTLGALLGGSSLECNFTNYARKTITSVTLTVSDAADFASLDFADQVWTNAGNGTNNTIVKALVCYDGATGSGTDSDIIPLMHFDVGVTTNGDDVTIRFHEEGLWRSE